MTHLDRSHRILCVQCIPWKIAFPFRQVSGRR